MAEEFKVEIIKRETIKPSSPTPPHLKIYQLSVLDQLQPVVYGQVVYFYPKNDISSEQRSHQLKKSLSESLVRFYPIAGRINSTTIDCNDEGAQYIEARFNGLLSTFLDQSAVLQPFLAAKMESPESGTWPQLLVQATFFDCGGLAIGICMSHKFADATTMGIFMKSWAETSNGSGQTVFPEFDGASYFPPIELSVQRPAVELKKAESVMKRYVFDKPKILELKANAAGDSVQQPTRVEVVTALILKCVMAASRSNLGGPKKYALTQSMNIRKRVDPPLPENLVGNVVGYFAVRTEEHHEEEPALRDLVALLRKGIREFAEKKAKRLREDDASAVICRDLQEAAELIRSEDTKVLIFTSLCNFQLYEAVDFGWGKPIWVTVPASESHSNVVTLMDTRGGGVEAWVTLTKEDMASFERDPDLLAFA
ncbi:Transferase [Parasponia andersonii]|uniref:Transferase n=1 Tax=Parasponia andersonii TaxID=3476 RepID=A0A2P5CUL5_PARAD|nr:Transferase [Parasponia andersonii]